jgi:hypothetical protein
MNEHLFSENMFSKKAFLLETLITCKWRQKSRKQKNQPTARPSRFISYELNGDGRGLGWGFTIAFAFRCLPQLTETDSRPHHTYPAWRSSTMNAIASQVHMPQQLRQANAHPWQQSPTQAPSITVEQNERDSVPSTYSCVFVCVYVRVYAYLAASVV